MTEPLFTVGETFRIRGRGRVIEGFSFDQYPLFKVGDVLTIERPDGSKVEAVIQAIEPPVGRVYAGEPPPMSERRYGLLIDVDDVPVGSVVLASRRPV